MYNMLIEKDISVDVTVDRNHFACKRDGFTLIEIIIVIALIGGIMALVIPRIQGYRLKAKIGEAKNTLLQLKEGIMLYETDTGTLPDRLENLVKRPQNSEIASKWTKGGYFGGKTTLPKDPWGTAYGYKITPDGSQPYELYSKGPDRAKAPKKEWIRVD